MMAKKDNSTKYAAPVEQYRKQIGKQNYKANKRDLKASKRAADKRKSGMPFKETILTLSAGLLVVMAVCLMLYWYLNYRESQKVTYEDEAL